MLIQNISRGEIADTEWFVFLVFFLISQNLIPFICGNMEACCLRAMLSVC